MANEQKNSNQTAIIGLIIVMAMVVFYFGVYVQGQSYHDSKLTADSKKIEADALTNKVSALQTLQSKFASQASSLQRLQTALPSDARPQEIIVMIDSIATKSGVNVNNIQPDQQHLIASKVPTANVTVTVTGNYAAQVAFAQAVEQNLRPIIINNFNLVANGDGSSLSGTYDLGFLISRVSPTVNNTGGAR